MYKVTVNEENFTVSKIHFWLPALFSLGVSLMLAAIFNQTPNSNGMFCFTWQPVTAALNALVLSLWFYQRVTAHALRNYIKDLPDNDTGNVGE